MVDTNKSESSEIPSGVENAKKLGLDNISADEIPPLPDLGVEVSGIKGSTTDIMKALAICLLGDKIGTKDIDTHDPILRQFIILDFKAARLGSELNSYGDLGPLRDTTNAGIAKLGTITQQPQAKQLSVVYREQFAAPEKTAAELIQSKIEISKLLNELIQAQLERITKVLARTLQTEDSQDEPTKRELYSLSQNLSGITNKINQFTNQQNITKNQLENLAKQVLAAIPATERAAANLPDPDNVYKLTNT